MRIWRRGSAGITASPPRVGRGLFWLSLSVAGVGFLAARAATGADYEKHITAVEKNVRGKGFTVIRQQPFVVIGDEEPTVVRRRAERTVQWAVDKLKQDYFEKDPEEILDIWLFKDEASYHKHTREMFGIEPGSPFGFYSPENHALIMNISTGGGTLVHEIVHPFVRADFPDCPAWFNEGFASLYEQSGERNGHIVGYTNWRLAGLQEAIRGRRLVSFQGLTGMAEGPFYEGKGDYYAQARYLCYYLQEQGLLVKFYRTFRAKCRQDPTGFQTLKEVLGEQDMGAFQKKWEAFVLKLKFPAP